MPSSGAQSKTTKRSAPTRDGARVVAKKAAKPGVLDDRAKREIVGVALAVVGIALLIAVLSHTNAYLAEASATGLKLAFGIGQALIGSFAIPVRRLDEIVER